MKYGSVCSGIEAASVAWHPLGWKASFLSEIEKFPREVLAHHYPTTPLHGDFTTIQKDDYEPIELLVGGTPCQSFSVAGLRAGLNDPRGNLMLEFGALAKRLQPKWLVWENVPGVLSSNGGRDFGSFLAMLGELGYGFAYRVLDAQHFGVPQRRRRVFVIGCIGDFRSAAAVLFERDSLQGNNPQSKSEGKETATTLTRGFGDRGLDLDQIAGGAYEIRTDRAVANCLTTKSNMRNNGSDEDFVLYALAGNTIGRQPENGGNGTGYDESGVSYTLTKTDVHAVAFNAQGSSSQGDCVSKNITPTLDKSKTPAVMHKMQVRRLMPIECERLQGFPDNYTNIPGASDSARYKALGNSMAVPVMTWIGKRIQMVENLQMELAA
jgi:DNA (cytosine-5)-methyltransferase 1